MRKVFMLLLATLFVSYAHASLSDLSTIYVDSQNGNEYIFSHLSKGKITVPRLLTQWLFQNMHLINCKMVALEGTTITIDSIEYVVDGETATLTNGKSRHGALSIPNNITSDGTTYRVTAIGTKAFENCSTLTTVTIPNRVTSIGAAAFSSCNALTRVIIGNGLKDLGTGAFGGCPKLKGFLVDNSNPYFSSADGVLLNKTGNKLIAYPEAEVKDSTYVFPSTIDSIGDGAFYGCMSLKSVNIPNSVKSIGMAAFALCGNLTTVTIPNSVTSIDDNTFALCIALTKVEIPNTVTSIGAGVFSFCVSLSSVTIPNNVTSIGKEAFSYTGLTSMNIPNGVTSIGKDAFYFCGNLASLTIPNSITSIGRNAFGHCADLESIICYRKEPLSISSNVFIGVKQSKVTLFVPKGCVTDYKSADVWKDFGTICEITITEGDLNEDGQVNVTDVAVLTSYILGTGTLPNFEKADINDDMNIDVSDVVALMRIILNAN